MLRFSRYLKVDFVEVDGPDHAVTPAVVLFQAHWATGIQGPLIAIVYLAKLKCLLH